MGLRVAFDNYSMILCHNAFGGGAVFAVFLEVSAANPSEGHG